jgi:hypothetical protein
MINGIHVSKGTLSQVAEQLYYSYVHKSQVRLHYGDTDTGEDALFLYNTTGVVTVSKGSQPAFELRNDWGSSPIKTQKIVKLVNNGVVVYQHPFYHVPTIQLQPNIDGTITLLSGERVLASRLTPKRARQVFLYINGIENIS